jgi:hypothetical protein
MLRGIKMMLRGIQTRNRPGCIPVTRKSHLVVMTSVSQTFCGGGRALEAFSKTRILLVGFGYHETNFRKLTEINGALMGGKRPFPGQRSSIGP